MARGNGRIDMIWKSVLFRPESLYEALFRQKLLGGGSETIIATDYTPYLYRSAPSFGQPYNRQRPVVVGGSLGWNQLVQNGNFADTSVWTSLGGSFAVADNVGTITVAGSAVYLYQQIQIPQGHKYFITADLKASDPVTSRFSEGSTEKKSNAVGTAWETFSGIFSITDTSGYINFIRASTFSGTINIRNAMFIDLTALFGSAVADAIYAMEQSVSGSGVAYVKTIIGDDYIPFNWGSLESVQTSAHVIRDGNNTVIGNYPLDPDLVLRGIPKWVDGALRYDGDIYHPNGTVDRKYGIVDLGSLTYTHQSLSGDRHGFSVSISDLALTTGGSQLIPAFSSAYVRKRYNDNWVSGDMSYYYPTGRTVIFINNNYTDASDFKTAMSGVYMVYELATPTTESATPYTALQMADPNGTEEWVTSGIVPVGQETEYIQK